MERPLTDNSQEIEVLDGQLSVEELLAELGFNWTAEPMGGGPEHGGSEGDAFTQPALF